VILTHLSGLGKKKREKEWENKRKLGKQKKKTVDITLAEVRYNSVASYITL
jgi:hypothetical protein